jgi:arylsulfatase A-like enzyme
MRVFRLRIVRAACPRRDGIITVAALVMVACAAAGTASADPGASESAPNRPNVVLVAIDTLRSDHLKCYGYGRDVSPNMDAVAADGVLFERCYSPASWTLPAFMSMFTGVLPAVHGCTRHDAALAETIPTLPALLHEKGYFCGAVVSNPFVSAKYGFGRGFDRYDDFTVFLDAELSSIAGEGDQSPPLRDVTTGQTVTRHAKQLISVASASGRPFFLFVHYFDPHDSYMPPPPFDRLKDPVYSGKVDGRGVPGLRRTPPAGRDLEQLVSLYDGEIAFNDAEVGKVVAALDAATDRRRTLLILTSDHGEAFGEHGRLLHGNSAFREETMVPMIWRWSGKIPAGRRVRVPVSTLDIPKTLSALTGLGDRMSHAQGESLWPGVMDGALPADRPILSEKAMDQHEPQQHVALSMGQFRLHAWYDHAGPDSGATFGLFDVQSDPAERIDLSATNPAQFARMTEQLSLFRRRSKSLRDHFSAPDAKAPVDLSERERRRLSELGYTNTPSAR